jgi:hypothetical protein
LKPKLAILPDGRLVAQNSSFLGLHTASLDKGCNRPGPDAGWFSAQNLVPILSRAGTADPAEYPREVLLRFETARHGDIKNPHLGLAQRLLCTLYPLPQDKLIRALAGRLPKHLQEMRCAEPCTLCHFVEGQLFFDLCVQYVMHLDKGQFPPVNGFWSLTMYDASYFFVPGRPFLFSLFLNHGRK